jgi:hypothetical protein
MLQWVPAHSMRPNLQGQLHCMVDTPRRSVVPYSSVQLGSQIAHLQCSRTVGVCTLLLTRVVAYMWR